MKLSPWKAAGLLVLMAQGVCAALASEPTDQVADSEAFNVHGQFTSVTQRQASFRSPYQAEHSLTPQAAQKETADITLYLGLRLWKGAEFYLNPEIDHGFGLSNTVGVAGFPSGEAYKVGKNRPYLKLPRLFLRQVVNLEGETEPVEAGPNALAGSISKNNVTFTVGKFSVGDIFDGNTYAHDPRADFLNWSIIEAGAFDYAADAWGFTHGGAAEWQTGAWTYRLGLFALSEEPNSAHIDKGFGQRAWIAEVERRYDLAGRHGEARLIWFRNQGRMGAYADAIRLSGTRNAPDTADVRRRNSKSGWALNLEQELAAEVGGFLRLSSSDGRQEAFEFTEINRSISGGVVLKGSLWGRPEHTWGTAVAVNGLASDAINYFRAGGLGILIGDGQLPNYGREQILETYYSIKLRRELTVSGNLQRVRNPAYNRDRGPVSIFGLRVHAEF
jgi:high affinity Mn2+ porin